MGSKINIDEKRLVKLHDSVKRIDDLADIFNVSRSVIFRRLKANGIYTGSKIVLDEKEVIRIYGKNRSLRMTASVFNVSTHPINTILHKNKIHLNSSRKYHCNDSYFKNINSEDKAYFLGLLFADGSVRKRKRYKNSKTECSIMRIKLHMKDVHILKRFKECLQSTYPIKSEVGHDGSENMRSITISSKEMVDNLIRHGCIPNKSLKLRFPTTVPKNLIHHFIRGYFDGDGTISWGKYNDGIYNRVYTYCGFLGTKQFLENIRRIINIKNNNGSQKRVGKQSPKGNIFVLAYHGKLNCYKLMKFMYRSSHVFLYRKHNIFKEIYEISR